VEKGELFGAGLGALAAQQRRFRSGEVVGSHSARFPEQGQARQLVREPEGGVVEHALHAAVVGHPGGRDFQQQGFGGGEVSRRQVAPLAQARQLEQLLAQRQRRVLHQVRGVLAHKGVFVAQRPLQLVGVLAGWRRRRRRLWQAVGRSARFFVAEVNQRVAKGHGGARSGRRASTRADSRCILGKQTVVAAAAAARRREPHSALAALR
jgi:hypothetical protein